MVGLKLLRFWVVSWLTIPVLGQNQHTPLFASGRWITDSSSKRVKLRCINWAGHMEVNLPEGLHKQPVEYLADWIHQEGFNCVRLTFSTDHAMNPDVKIRQSFVLGAKAAAVSESEMLKLYDQALQKNPFLADPNMTQRDVFARVVDVLWERSVMTVLDNHVSKASWCCDLDDGNGWWRDARIYWPANSRYFDTDLWLAGLQRTSLWAKTRPGVVAISMRNELRATWTQIPFAADQWYSYVARGAEAIHKANPDVLVIVGGLNSATDFSPLRTKALDTSAWKTKHVWEAHSYSFTVTTPNFGDCNVEKAQYGTLFGFVLEQHKRYTGPLFLSEFGVGMVGGPQDGLSVVDHAYLTCLVGYLEGNDADWALWAIQGTYYVRNKVLDFDETWGVMDHEWNGWRNPAVKRLLGNIFSVTQGP
ncbi:Glycosyl hydrolase 5 family protein [Colletotrichum spinosum]|uniref:Glycosyl hydrolase 5 family protein n=1 Tax=Colletotrichum spinosum TaxID=1347390 RepID=A0A4R8Q0N8_9PEZI|nr:Glycosyl hydrolase 5 family protein [Colletotrichum spinosum]